MPKSENPQLNILLIAPVGGGQSDANIVGGNKVMADEQVRELNARGFHTETVDTSGNVTNLSRWKIRANRIARFLRVAWGAAKKLRGADVVSLIIAPYSAISLASFFWVICQIARRPLVVRITGSALGSYYRGYGPLARWLAHQTWMRSALVYVETQQSLQDFNHLANFRWFPNTRDLAAPAAGRDKVNKLIFVARLETQKGLAEALEACRHLPEDCHLNVFGPGMSGTDFSLFDGHPRATYGGILEPAEIPRALSEHDLLVYPSYFTTEGYPGVILEAFQCGRPVVAARSGSISELVEHEESGLLVEPRSAAAVRSAIERLLADPELYRRLCAGAERRGDYFRSANWYDTMASDLRACTEDRPRAGRPVKPPNNCKPKV